MTRNSEVERKKLLQKQLNFSPHERTLIVAHDQGAADVIADLVPYLDNPVRIASAGPASLLFDRFLPNRHECDVEDGLDWCETLIVGSGWQTSWEISAQRLGQNLGKRTAVVLDNWLNYQERFSHHSISVHPEELWVVDAMADLLAHEAFPDTLVRRLPWNRYEAFVDEIRRAREDRSPQSSEDIRVLFLSEDMQGFGREMNPEKEFGFDQFEAIHYLSDQLTEVLPEQCSLVVRPHPSEDPCSYDRLEAREGVPIRISQSTLIDDFVWCEISVGMSSMAMYYSHQSGIPTFACFPDKNSGFDRSPWNFPDVEEYLRKLDRA